MIIQLTNKLKLFFITVVVLKCLHLSQGESQEIRNQDDFDEYLDEYSTEIDDFTINRDTEVQCGNNFCYSSTDKCCGYTSSLWGSLCRTGKAQSPINLPGCKIGVGNPIPPLTIDGDAYKGKFQLMNDGNALVLNFIEKKSVNVSGAGVYILDHLRFHWASGLENDTVGSEHCIKWMSGGSCVRESMELQLIHYKGDKINLESAIESGQRNAVLAISLLLRAPDGKSSNPKDESTEESSGSTQVLPVLNPVLKHLEEIAGSGESTTVTHTFDLTPWFSQPTLVSSYFGSMTTPKCKQVVRWYVFQTPRLIKAQDVARFRILKQANGQPLLSNKRPMQKKNKRDVQCYQVKMQNDPTML